MDANTFMHDCEGHNIIIQEKKHMDKLCMSPTQSQFIHKLFIFIHKKYCIVYSFHIFDSFFLFIFYPWDQFTQVTFNKITFNKNCSNSESTYLAVF